MTVILIGGALVILGVVVGTMIARRRRTAGEEE
jgi:hypothetical protein